MIEAEALHKNQRSRYNANLLNIKEMNYGEI